MTVILVLVGLLALVGVWVVLTTNTFIRARNKVDEAWSGIDVQLKRRHDLVPNLVETVKGYAEHESATLASVTQARSAAMGAGTREERGAAEGAGQRGLGAAALGARLGGHRRGPGTWVTEASVALSCVA